ncbi:MAG: transcriptional regulator NrdR [Simkaniaceae bacterium]|nr:transcriptional regulator NrdR [Simkaniaceae bacterium]
MHCPFCNHPESKVTDSRNSTDQNMIKRRRECLSCGKRFTTFETIELNAQVRKRNGTFQDFSLEKLRSGIAACCRHTRISNDEVRTLASEIASEVQHRGLREVSTTQIGEMVMERLKKLDSVAYIRFACVYKRFKDMDELMDAIQTASTC